LPSPRHPLRQKLKGDFFYDKQFSADFGTCMRADRRGLWRVGT
jgi:hypothetical protein